LTSLAAGRPAVRPLSLAAVHVLQVVCAAVWGLTHVAGRVAAAEASPLNAAFWRFAMAAMVLAPLALIADARAGRSLRDLAPRDWLGVALSALTGLVLYNLFFIKGLATVEASRGSVIVCVSPALIWLGSVLILGVKPTFAGAFGVALSALGTVWVATSGRPGAVLSGGVSFGDLLMMACPVVWAAYSLLGARLLGRVNPVSANALSVVAAVVMLAVLVPVAGAPPGEAAGYGAATWASLAFLGLGGTAVGFTLYYLGIRALGAHRAAAYINLVPVFGVLSGWLILDERPKASLLAGLALILVGIRLVQRRR
jgi:drug/metabolite transporter (DMT)-like permease